MLHNKLYIKGEIVVRIQHHLLSLKNLSISNVRKVFSHPQALKQCSFFLKSLPDIEIVTAYDTAGAAKYIKYNNCEGFTAITGKQVAREYGLTMIRKNIENNDTNYTRFVVLGNEIIHNKMDDKTSIVLSLPDKPESLYECLGVFNKKNINLIKVESRQVIGFPWNYYFYIDFVNSNHDALQQVLEESKTLSHYFRLLGIYPTGRTIN